MSSRPANRGGQLPVDCDANPPDERHVSPRLHSDEASYRVFLLAVTLLLKARFTSLGVAAS